MMIITDSASDITRQEAEEMNIRIVWLKTKFSDGDFPLETEEDFTRFFEKLAAEKNCLLQASRHRRNIWLFMRKQRKTRKRFLLSPFPAASAEL